MLRIHRVSSGPTLLNSPGSKEFSRYQPTRQAHIFWWTIWIFWVCFKMSQGFFVCLVMLLEMELRALFINRQVLYQ